MTCAPWMKFYPRDWRGDQALRAVSIAARGLWIECLCIMHEAKPYGHLVLNGAPVEADALARMTGVPVDEVSDLLSELRQAGVLSVTSKGVVFSRRMTKDHARAQKGRKAANKRWLQASDDVEQSEAPNGLPNGYPITQKPEARYQKDKPPEQQQVAARGAAAALPRNWIDILATDAGIKGNPPQGWALGAASIIALIERGFSWELDIRPAVRAKPNPRARSPGYFVPQIEEYRARRLDGGAPVQITSVADYDDPTGKLRTWPVEKWRLVMERFRQDGNWNRMTYGPPPGEPGSFVPAELQAH